MSRLLLSVLVVLVSLSVLAAGCPSGSTPTEITTPGLLDGFVPETGELTQQPALTLTLWPISLSLLPALKGNVTEFIAALGPCLATTGCAEGKVQLGLYHFHFVGTFDPNEAGKVHLISYSDLISYHPHSSPNADVPIEYKRAKAHAQQAQLVPNSIHTDNAFTGYFIGIVSTVPYGIYFGGLTLLPVYLSQPYPDFASNQKLLANPELSSFDFAPTATEAALGFFYCPD